MTDADDPRRAGTGEAKTRARDAQSDGQGAPAGLERAARPRQDVLPVYAVRVDAASGDWIGQPVATGSQTTARDWAGREDTGLEHYRIHVHHQAGEGDVRAIILQWVFH